MKKILAIDGGGIRGVIPTFLLAEIENRTGKYIAELFDLIAGTSTGAILALGLNKPDLSFPRKPQYTARALANLYLEHGQEIFPLHLYNNAWGFAGSLHHAKYPYEPLEKILDKYFGEARLSKSLKDVLVTSYDIERRQPQIFLSSNAKNNNSEDFLMKKLVRAASAAPTYFEPLKIPKTDPLDYYALVDGGIFANNPALYAYIEAKRIYANENDFLIVSLGTGEHAPSLPYEQARTWGLVGWGQQILNIVFDGVSSATHYQLQNLIPKDRYYRFQTALRSADEYIDNAKPENIGQLKNLAEKMIADNRELINKVCNLLLQ